MNLRPGRKLEEPEINVVSLIDVVLLLVVFFILSAKFTDEGWWASAAVRHFLIGHWQVPGDYNPATVVPVWPALLTLVFQFTGVSIIAVRAVSVSLSIETGDSLWVMHPTRRKTSNSRATAR